MASSGRTAREKIAAYEEFVEERLKRELQEVHDDRECRHITPCTVLHVQTYARCSRAQVMRSTRSRRSGAPQPIIPTYYPQVVLT